MSKKSMLEANKSLWFEKVFSIYNRNLLKRRFNSFRISGLENLQNLNTDIPTIFYCNHSSWWDGLVAFQISREINLDSYVMMEEKQLKYLRLFRRLGAFSVVRENPREAVKSIKYAIHLLKEDSNRTLWMFPQGEILPNDLRPLKFFNGISRIVQKLSKCQLFCTAMRYEFLGKFKPEIFVKIGESETVNAVTDFDTKNFTRKLVRNLTASLDNLKKDILKNDLKSYQNIL